MVNWDNGGRIGDSSFLEYFMLTPFLLGWILAEQLGFEMVQEFTIDDFGGHKFFPEIALGVVSYDCR